MAEDAAADERTDGVRASSRTPPERLEAFASIVNHDFRNPLNVAQGRLELARESNEPDEHLAVVDRAHERLAGLIESSVTWARSGGPVENPEAVEVDAVFQEIVGRTPDGEIEPEVATAVTVQADRHRLHQVFEALVDNAVDHAEPPVTMRVGATADGFFVEDTGPGIPEEQREQVFEPGYSTDSEAPGFGLAVVATVAAAHNWDVSVGKRPGGGARFEFTTTAELD